MIIKGKILASEVNESTRERVEKIGQSIKLAIILVGTNPDSIRYIEHKMKMAVKLSLNVQLLTYPENVDKGIIVDVLEKLNADKNTHGILIQMPLPEVFVNSNGYGVSRELIDMINPIKDVDGLTNVNIGKLVSGEADAISPATPKGIIELLKKDYGNLEGKHIVILNRSLIVGKPLLMLALQENAVVTVIHSKTKDISSFTKQADILVTAVGKPGIITKEMVKEGAVVIDVGIGFDNEGKLRGDVNTIDVSEIADVTPVPGGIGPLTIAFLLNNLVTAYERQARV